MGARIGRAIINEGEFGAARSVLNFKKGMYNVERIYMQRADFKPLSTRYEKIKKNLKKRKSRLLLRPPREREGERT